MPEKTDPRRHRDHALRRGNSLNGNGRDDITLTTVDRFVINQYNTVLVKRWDRLPDPDRPAARGLHAGRDEHPQTTTSPPTRSPLDGTLHQVLVNGSAACLPAPFLVHDLQDRLPRPGLRVVLRRRDPRGPLHFDIDESAAGPRRLTSPAEGLHRHLSQRRSRICQRRDGRPGLTPRGGSFGCAPGPS